MQLSCPAGGLPSLRHNEIRDVLAATVTEVCVDIKTEPAIPSAESVATDTKEIGPLEILARGFS